MSPSDPPASHDPILAARDEVASARVVPALQADPNGPGEQPGDHIGRYKLLQRIGEGGFGVVWMAEQTEPVRRKVALKVIKLGMDTRQVIARFEAERQALALMDHPHIAKVLDGGATEQGRPFFVMELVKGVPITEFCDRAKLGLRQRLDLFVKVCGAVQHAHTKGVIHRDLKPGNVLVTLHDGEPVPKVIDFGIAKATSAELTQKTLFTEFRQMIGTPEYMAPEQAELSGLDVDTRADVYSLGVLLYELLTGTKPFDIRAVLERGYQELLRTICEEDPPPPSTRVSTLGEQGGEIALSRGAEPGRLGVVLRGDLDWIVMRALEKDRTRRYETVNGLAADVRRYLDDEPVLATPPSAAYRLRKLVRRNKGLFVGAAAVLAVLLLGIAGTTAGLIASMRAEDRARAEAVLARTAQASEARQREEAVAQRAVAEEQSRRAQLATEAEASQRELAEAETARALAAERVASARFDSARGLARAMMDEVGGRLHNVPGTLPARRALLESVLTYLDELSVDASDDEALQVEVADAYMRLGVLLGDPFSGEAIGDFDGALEANRRALELRQALAAAHPDKPGYRATVIRAQDALASSLSVLGRDEESLELHLAALAAARELAEAVPMNRELARFMQRRLGNAYAGLERYTDALDQFFPLHEDMVDLRVNPDVDPPDLVHAVKVSYHQMARCWQGLGELDLAFEDSAQTLRFARALHVRYPDDARYLRDVAGRLRYHGLLLLEFGRLDEALGHFAESEELGRSLHERDPENALAARFQLANLLDLAEAYADAAERSPMDSEQRRELRTRAAGLLREGLDHLADLSRGDMRAVLETQIPAEEREELRRKLAELQG